MLESITFRAVLFGSLGEAAIRLPAMGLPVQSVRETVRGGIVVILDRPVLSAPFKWEFPMLPLQEYGGGLYTVSAIRWLTSGKPIMSTISEHDRKLKHRIGYADRIHGFVVTEPMQRREYPNIEALIKEKGAGLVTRKHN